MAPYQNHPGPGHGPDDPALAKQQVRGVLLARRRRLTPAALAAEADRLADHALAVAEVRSAATVTCYVALGPEPDTGTLLTRLHAAGIEILLPVLLADNDLDWAPYDGPGSLRPGRFGLREPGTGRRGVDAVATADVLLVPGLAVSETGQRLGRGGGSYDRALARAATGAFAAVLLHPDEVGVAVPVEPHDRPVHAAITADGVRRF